jgi:hypothetical protein
MQFNEESADIGSRTTQSDKHELANKLDRNKIYQAILDTTRMSTK